MRDTFGDKFKLEPRSRKHRYVYIVANKATKKIILEDLKYKQEDYPKGKTRKYDASYNPATQSIFDL